MSAAGRLEPLDWEAYLEGEEHSERKHEYVNGFVYAMAGSKLQLARITSNVLLSIGRRLPPVRARSLTPI